MKKRAKSARRSDLSKHARSGYVTGQRAATYTSQEIIPATVFVTAAVAGYVVGIVAEIVSAVTEAVNDPLVPTPIPGPKAIAARLQAAPAEG